MVTATAGSTTTTNSNYTVTIMQYPEAGASLVSVKAPMPESFMYDAAAQYAAPFTGGLTGNQMIDTILRVGVAARLVTQSLTAQFWQGSTETELGVELEFQAEQDPDKEVRQPILALLRLTTPSTKTSGLLTSPGPRINSPQLLSDLVSRFVSTPFGASFASAFPSILPSTAPANKGPGIPKTGNMVDGNQSVADGSQSPNPVASADPSDANSLGTAAYFDKYIVNKISIQIGNYALFSSVVVTNVQTTFESQFDQYGIPHYARVAVRFKPLFMVVQDDLNKIFLSSTATPASTNKPPIGVAGGVTLAGSTNATNGIGAFDSTGPNNPVQAQAPTTTFDSSPVPGTNSTFNGGIPGLGQSSDGT